MKEIRRKINIKRKKGKKESWNKAKKRGARKMCDLGSRGTRAQMQIKEEQIKKIRNGKKGRERVDGGVGYNKYKSPNFKALMMIKKQL